MLPVSLDCSCFIALSVFYNIYLSCVLSTLCCQFLWIVHVLLPFRSCVYNIICPVSCLPCVLLPFRYVYNIYLSCVLSTLLLSLCCQFLWIVHVLLPCQYSITFICPVSCLLYVASFSGLFMFYCPVSSL